MSWTDGDDRVEIEFKNKINAQDDAQWEIKRLQAEVKRLRGEIERLRAAMVSAREFIGQTPTTSIDFRDISEIFAQIDSAMGVSDD